MPSSENTTILSPATISNSEQHGQGTTTFSASVTKEDAVHLTRFPKPDERQDEECQICRDDLKPKDRAQLIPCFHWQYHKECIETWLKQSRTCPICMQSARSVVSGLNGETTTVIPPSRHPMLRIRRRIVIQHRIRDRQDAPVAPRFLNTRMDIYRSGRYALHIGSSAHNSYRVLSVDDFSTDEHLARRASAFIRRELLVIDRLDSQERQRSPDLGLVRHLLEQRLGREYFGSQRVDYIMRVLKTADMQGANGAAEEMLRPVVGGVTAQFLHELRAFLRSPFDRVEEWDEVVRYGPPTRGTRVESIDAATLLGRRESRLPRRVAEREGRWATNGMMSFRARRGETELVTESL